RGLPARDRDALFADVLHRFATDARYARGIDARALAARHEGAGAGAGVPPAEPAPPPGAPHMCSWRFAPPKPEEAPPGAGPPPLWSGDPGQGSPLRGHSSRP